MTVQSLKTNGSEQPGLRAYTILKKVWQPSWIQDGGHKIFVLKSCPFDPEINTENLKIIS